MLRRFIYSFLLLCFCLTTTRGDLTMEPLSSWEITDNFGDVLSLNGYPVSNLIVGTSEYANPGGGFGANLVEYADDPNLYTSASADAQDWMKTYNRRL